MVNTYLAFLSGIDSRFALKTTVLRSNRKRAGKLSAKTRARIKRREKLKLNHLSFRSLTQLILFEFFYCNLADKQSCLDSTGQTYEKYGSWTDTIATVQYGSGQTARQQIRIQQIYKPYNNKSSDPLYILSILNIFDINTLVIALLMFNYNNNLLPKNFDNYFHKNSNVHEYKTR